MATHGHVIDAMPRPMAVEMPGHAATWLTWGGMIGLVQLFAVLTVGPLGVSTAYPQVVGGVLGLVIPGFAEQQYLKEIGSGLGWEVMLALGIPIGALLSWAVGRAMDRPAGETMVAPVVVRGFQGGRLPYLRAFVGGFIFVFGARLAGGCTTGHILSGTAQMAISGLVFAFAVFAVGHLFARMLFREPTGERGEG
jgi:hypothetical protein